MRGSHWCSEGEPLFLGHLPSRDTPDIWPALPLHILCEGDYPTGSVDNIIAVLEHSDRVCRIDLSPHLVGAFPAGAER